MIRDLASFAVTLLTIAAIIAWIPSPAPTPEAAVAPPLVASR